MLGENVVSLDFNAYIAKVVDAYLRRFLSLYCRQFRRIQRNHPLTPLSWSTTPDRAVAMSGKLSQLKGRSCAGCSEGPVPERAAQQTGELNATQFAQDEIAMAMLQGTQVQEAIITGEE